MNIIHNIYLEMFWIVYFFILFLHESFQKPVLVRHSSSQGFEINLIASKALDNKKALSSFMQNISRGFIVESFHGI